MWIFALPLFAHGDRPVPVDSRSALSINRVELLPDRPSPFQLRNFRQTAVDFDRLVFDFNATGQYLPLIWTVDDVPNLGKPGFGLPSYVGGEEMRGKPAEGIAALGTLLGATAVGIDKSKWVELTPQYLNTSEHTILNNVRGKSGSSFWYELVPSVVFTQLASKYPNWSRGRLISKGIADAWIGGMDALGGNFDHTSYDLQTKRAFDNKEWAEPDAAAAVAYLELFQGLRSRDAKYYTAARRALRALQDRDSNPTYEVMTAFGVLSAAYLNAAAGDQWDVPRFLNWCFDPTSPNRAGWGMVAGNWGGYDVGGLMGSTNDGGGYAFAMNTFVNAANLAPVARYDDRYSASLAKWILNLSNSARLFYADSLPAANQSSSNWKGDPKASIAYEGLRRSWEGKAPFATGDAKRSGWAKEDFGLYGGGYGGLLGALVHPTNVPMILRIDLRATDYLPVNGYPTDLIWNPYDDARTVRIDLGSAKRRLYDAVSDRFLSAAPVSRTYALRLNPKQAVQLVRVPAQGRLVYQNNMTLVDGTAIDFNNGRVPLPLLPKRTVADQSERVGVARAHSDGTADWASSRAISLSGGEGSTMRAELRFAWNQQYLYFRVEEVAKSTEVIEAPSLAELQKHWWDFEDVALNFDLGRQEFAVATVPEITAGWSSKEARGLAFSPDIENVSTSTSGDAARANRVIKGKIAWADLLKAAGVRKPIAEIVRVGAKIGCQPLMVDGTFRRQAYIGGMRFRRPTGYDANSRTLVLESR
jgi:hypothetical protein